MKIYLLSIGFILFLFTGCIPQDTSLVFDNKTTINKHLQESTEKDSATLEKISLKANDTVSEYSSDIAIIFSSQVIGKYAINATNSAMSYLIYKNENFNLKVFDIENENILSIQNAFKDISKNGISKVLVLFTYGGAKHLKDVEDIGNYDIYLPLIHKNDLDLNINSIVYGSIDYSKQFDELFKLSNGKQVEFHDNTDIGRKLSKIISNKDINLAYQKMIDDDNGEYYRFLSYKNTKLKNATLIVNMPIVKSSIVLSQISANDIKLNKILSTQLNYTPLLLSLTQVHDRRKMIIANSINKIDKVLEECNTILDNDLVYDWVNYSTSIGIEYLISKNFSSFENITLNKQQIEYPINLFSTTKYSFQKY